jgi:hypothetical protein
MTLEEKNHLYYGYVFNKNYSPYNQPDTKNINEILSKDTITEAEWAKLIPLTDTLLKVVPFNLRNIYYQMIAYKKLGKLNDAAKNNQKILCVLDAMNSTGDALTMETAIHVIAVSNEYDYMFFINVSLQSQTLIQGGYDLLSLQPNDSGIEELWFDVNQPLGYLDKTFK